MGNSRMVEVLLREAAKRKAEPTESVVTIFRVAENLGHQRSDNNGLLTTSLLFFAAVEIGRNWRERSEGDFAYVRLLVDVLDGIFGQDQYLRWRSEYFRDRPILNDDAPDQPLKELSPNTREALHRALSRSTDGQLNAETLFTELLDNPSARINENLRKYGVSPEKLIDEMNRLMSRPTAGIGSPNVQRMKKPDIPPQPNPVPSEAPPLLNYVSSFQNDDPRNAADDFITISDEVEALARLAASRKVAPPISIAVFGDWGSGKTFFMERMHARVQSLTKEDTKTFFTHIVQIRFNAWHYIETNLWASLVEYIFNELDAWLRAKDVDGSKVDELFDQLATSRQIKLDAYRDLVAIRAELRTAEAALQTARSDYDVAVKASATRPLESAWPAIAKAFGAALTPDEKGKLKSAVDALGVSQIQASAGEVAALVDRTREQAVRAQVIGNALVTRLGSKDAIVAAVLILGAPVAVGLIAGMSHVEWVKDLNAGMLGAVSSISAALLVASKWVNLARQGLDRLDILRVKLDEQAARAYEDERRSLAEADTTAEHARQAAAEAELRVAVAREREASARQDYQSETARGRLNRFIRAKVADASYAKHLGVVASIRKDFGQLSSLMSQGGLEASINADVQKAEALHRMKVGALIADAKARELLKPDEIADLNEKKVEKPDASFERIVLYIDDLDRCPPDKVVDVLQAIHMLLYFPLFVVVVAVDVRWVSRSLKDRFPKLLADRLSAGADAAAQNGPEAADAHDYLEKIFQIPFWVRRMDGPSSAQFVEGVAKQFAKTERSTGKDKQEDTTGGARDGTEAPSGGAAGGQQESPSGSTAGDGNRTGKGTADGKKAPKDPPGFDQMTLSGDEQKMLATFAPFVGGSPRRAKRYVNLYLLLKTILRPVGNVQEWAIAGLLANSTGTNRSDDNFLASFQNKSAAARAAGTNSKIGSAVDALIVAVSLNFPKQEDDLQTALQRFAPTVRRYSFW